MCKQVRQCLFVIEFNSLKYNNMLSQYSSEGGGEGDREAFLLKSSPNGANGTAWAGDIFNSFAKQIFVMKSKSGTT